jgi:hypothetical protein
MYGGMYSDWNDSDYISIKVFHVPGFVWLAIFIAISMLMVISIKIVNARTLKKLNVAYSLWLLLVVFHVVDWTTSFLFCHEWGCSGKLSPIWYFFQHGRMGRTT